MSSRTLWSENSNKFNVANIFFFLISAWHAWKLNYSDGLFLYKFYHFRWFLEPCSQCEKPFWPDNGFIVTLKCQSGMVFGLWTKFQLPKNIPLWTKFQHPKNILFLFYYDIDIIMFLGLECFRIFLYWNSIKWSCFIPCHLSHLKVNSAHFDRSFFIARKGIFLKGQ